MRNLSLDYSREHTPAVGLTRAALLGVGLGLLAVSSFVYVQRWQELAGLRAQADELRLMAKRSGGALRARPGDSREIEAEVRRANAVLEQLNLPWLDLLDAIEATRGEKVALLSIQPDSRQRTVRIAAEAKTVADALEYVRRLGAHPRFGGVHLLNHEIVQQDAQKPVRVQLVAGWRNGS